MLLSKSLVLAGFAALASCRPSRSFERWGGWGAETLYFMTNEAANAVVSLPIAQDGSLSTWKMVATGGVGGSLVSPTNGSPDGPDALGSQGSVQVADNVSIPRDSSPSCIVDKSYRWSLPSIPPQTA
jgi:hypothetical protein